VARKNSRSRAVVAVAPEKALDIHRAVLPPNERRLNFGGKWEFAPAPEQSDYIKLKPRYQHFINGKFVAPQSGKYFPC